MTGIVSYGAYIPIYRMSKEALNAVWGSGGGPGERAVASSDEDSLTLAVEAAIDCVTGRDRKAVNGLYFVSTTSPFREKQCASIAAAAVDLNEQIQTGDFANSLRGGTNALNAALDAVNSGSAKEFMITAADCRLASPDTGNELNFGDGSAALLIGKSGVAVEVESRYSTTTPFVDSWKTEEDKSPRFWEERFTLDEGYLKLFPQAIKALLKQCNMTIKDFAKVVIYAPDSRSHARVAQIIGADPKTQLQSPLFGQLGHTGAAFGLMMLIAALESAKAGDKILFAAWGDGADVYVLKVTPEIEKLRDRRGIKKLLAAKMMLPNYGKYLHYRDIMDWERDLRPAKRTSLPNIWREQKFLFALYGQKCKTCGEIQFPKRVVCQNCSTKNNFELYRLADKKGKLFTFSMDERAMEINLPKVLSIVDIDGGGRIYTSLTDRDTTKVEVGMPVEFTFRKIHDGSGIHNYFWKARPVRC